MSEKYIPKHEAQSAPERAISHETKQNHHEQLKPAEVTHSKEEIYKKIEAEAISKDARTIEEKSPHHDRPHHYITQTVKRGVYAHTIKNVQTHLKPSERRFSKIIHNDTVETLSELGAGTVARPSAILGGGIFMVFGGLALLLTARYFGFTIPLSALLALYVVGFILLFVIDILSKPIKKRFSKKY